MRHILFAITMLMLCLSVNGQELKVTGSRKAVRTSGDVLVFITPVASLATVLATQDWQGLKQGVFTGVTTLGVTYALKYLVKKERPVPIHAYLRILCGSRFYPKALWMEMGYSGLCRVYLRGLEPGLWEEA